MSDPRPDLGDILAGDLDAAGWAAAEERMRIDPAFRAEVERLAPIRDALQHLPADVWNEAAPPPLRAPAKAAPARFRRPSATVFRAGAAAAAVVIALAAFGLGRMTADGDRTASGRTVDLPALDAGPGSGTAEIAADGGMMTVRLADLPPSAGGEFYELWLLNSPEDLISVGSIRMPASGEVEVTLPVPLRPERYQFLDLSIELVDGNPAHSGMSVLRGETA